jgi:hypothetical protein
MVGRSLRRGCEQSCGVGWRIADSGLPAARSQLRLGLASIASALIEDGRAAEWGCEHAATQKNALATAHAP